MNTSYQGPLLPHPPKLFNTKNLNIEIENNKDDNSILNNDDSLKYISAPKALKSTKASFIKSNENQ
jgi:hypothetical protein